MNLGEKIRDRLGVAMRSRAWMAVLAAAAVTVIAAFAWFPGRAGVPVSELERQFREAGRAYGEGRFRDAARLYEGLMQRGYVAPELFFNLGNAHLKDGKLGPAVLGYRKAWRLAPRDPDVDANLRLALQAAGAAEADLSSFEIAFTLLSEGEWAAVATIAWWTACLGVALALVFPKRRALPLRLAAAAALLAALALCGLRAWRGFDSSPELVVLHDTRNALTAPLASAPPSFSLPEGSVVRARGHQGEWVNVTHGQLSGWIRRGDCAPVLLAAAPEQ